MMLATAATVFGSGHDSLFSDHGINDGSDGCSGSGRAQAVAFAGKRVRLDNTKNPLF